MKKIISILSLAAFCLCFTACRIIHKNDIGPSITKNFQTKPFKKIVVKGPHTVRFTQSDTFSIKVTAPEETMNYLLIESDGQTLHISNNRKDSDNGVIRIFNYVDDSSIIEIQAPSLSAIGMFGSGEFITTDSLSAETFEVTVSGSGEINLQKVSSKKADITVTGSGDVTMGELTTETANITVTGSGDIALKGKNINKTKMDVTGSGDISITFDNCNEATAGVTGSGDITLKGTLRNLKKSISGSGEVSTDGLTIIKQ